MLAAMVTLTLGHTRIRRVVMNTISKTIAVLLITSATLFAAAPAIAGWRTNGTAINGLSRNGIQANGLRMNGLSRNGITRNGTSLTDTSSWRVIGIELPE
jgi:hypothetical protein